ncbi:MAG: protein kinase [Planctomycetaceae bacterium]|nr:protein kinase [Planctomycetaceae bacterium]
MTSRPPSNEIALLREIDSIADRFESEWSANRQPRIEDFLSESSDEVRPRLFSELLAIEVEWRARRGLPVDSAEYERRFPDAREVISAVLSKWEESSLAPAPAGKPDQENADDARLVGETVISSRAGESSSPQAGRSKVSPVLPGGSELPRTIGRYKVLKLLGAGAMGKVYLALDEELQRRVAIKVPKQDIAANSDEAERFRREARAAATLNHPNICAVHDIGETDGHRYITMAYIEGRSLQAITRNGRQQPQRQAAMLIRKLAQALQTAHEQGIVHRDLKPANIMLDKKHEPVIMDFGLALLVDREEEARLTHSGVIVGSPAYMSPEQVSGDPNAVGPQSDIYSLGVILYELLASHLPYQGGVMAVLSQIQTTDPPPIQTQRQDVDPALATICHRMMARSLGDRYASMREVADDLTRWLKGEGSTTPQTMPTPSPQASLEELARGARTQTWVHRTRRPTPPWWNRSTAIAAAVLLPVILMGVLMLLRTSTGDVRIEVNDARIGVELDGDRITLTDLGWKGKKRAGKHQLSLLVNGVAVPIGETLPITIEGQDHQLVATLGGMRLSSSEFHLERDKTAALEISLVPRVSPSGRKSDSPETPPSPTAQSPPPPAPLRLLWKRQVAPPPENGKRRFPVQYVGFTSDNRSLITAIIGKVELLSAADGQSMRRLPYGGAYLGTSIGQPLVASVMSRPDSSVGTDVLNLASGETVPLVTSELESFPSIKRLAISPDGSLCALGTARHDEAGRLFEYNDFVVWNVRENRILWERSLPGDSSLKYFRFSPDGRFLLAGNCREEGNTQKGPLLLDAHTGRSVKFLAPYVQGYSTDAEFLPDGSAVLVTTISGKFVQINLDDPTKYRDFNWPYLTDLEQKIYGIEVTPDGKHAWTARGDGKVALWNLQQGKPIREIEDLYPKDQRSNLIENRNYAFELSPDGRYLAITDNEGSVALYEVAGDLESLVLETVPPKVPVTPQMSQVPAPEHKREASPPLVFRELWQRQVAGDGKEWVYMAFADFVAGGKSIVTANSTTEKSNIELLDATDGRFVSRLPFYTPNLSSCRNLAFLAATVGTGPAANAEIWELEPSLRGRSLRAVDDSLGRATIAISPDGKLCVQFRPGPVVEPREQKLVAWDIEQNEVLWEKSIKLAAAMRFLRFSGDGRHLLVPLWRPTGGGEYDIGPMLLDARTGEERHFLRPNVVSSVVDGEFLPDDSAVVLPMVNGNLVLLDVENPSDMRMFHWPSQTEEPRAIQQVELTPDGKYALTASADGQVGIWDLKFGVLLQELDDIYPGSKDIWQSPLPVFELSHDGGHLLVGDGTGLLTVYEVTTVSGSAVVRAVPTEPALTDFEPRGLRELWSSRIGAASDNEPTSIRCFDFIEDGKSLLVAIPKAVELLSTVEGKSERRFATMPYVPNLATCREGTRFVIDALQAGAGTGPGPKHRTQIWDLKSGEWARHISPSFTGERNNTSGSRQLAISPDGRICVLAAIRVLGEYTWKVGVVAWDVERNELLWELDLHHHLWPPFVRLSHDGRLLLVPGHPEHADYGPILVEAQSGTVLHALATPGHACDGEFLPDDSAVLITTNTGTILQSDTNAPSKFRLLNWPGDGNEGRIIPDIEITPGGRYAFITRQDGKIGVWDLQAGKLLREFEGFVRAYEELFMYRRCFELSPDGRHLAIADSQRGLTMYEVLSESIVPEPTPASSSASNPPARED